MPAFIPLSLGRLIIGLPIAACVTAGLFLVMSGIITQGDVPPEGDLVTVPSINAKVPPPEGPDLINPVIPQEFPPAPPPIRPDRSKRNSVPDNAQRVRPKKPTREGSGELTIEQALVPIIRVEPAYPQGCAQRGAEGPVTVEFDISPQGAILNPRIISSVDRCFERATLQAVRKWKYSPVGRTTRNVRTTINFRLN
ncbi:MAG: TonB family protein [Pseudomonadota bacterium]